MSHWTDSGCRCHTSYRARRKRHSQCSVPVRAKCTAPSTMSRKAGDMRIAHDPAPTPHIGSWRTPSRTLDERYRAGAPVTPSSQNSPGRAAIGYDVRKAVIPEISPVDDPKPAIVEFFTRDHLEGAPVRLAFLVDRDRGCPDSSRLVQPELQDVAQALLHFAGCQQKHEQLSEPVVALARPRDPEHFRQVLQPELKKVLDEDAEGRHHLAVDQQKRNPRSAVVAPSRWTKSSR